MLIPEHAKRWREHAGLQAAIERSGVTLEAEEDALTDLLAMAGTAGPDGATSRRTGWHGSINPIGARRSRASGRGLHIAQSKQALRYRVPGPGYVP